LKLRFIKFFFFWQKQNDIHSFKLIEYIRINIAKIVKGEYANKLTTPKLIAYNGEMPTNNMINLNHKNTHVFGSAMLTSKSLIESVINRSWFFNMNQTNTATKHKIKQRRQNNEQRNFVLRRQNWRLPWHRLFWWCSNDWWVLL